MDRSRRDLHTRERSFLLTVYSLFYFGWLAFQFLRHRLLFQARPVLFQFNRDLAELAVIASGLTRWMIVHPLSFAIADGLAFLLPIAMLAAEPRRRVFGWLCTLFILFLGLYLLLADIFLQIHLEPLILYVLLPLALIGRSPARFDWIMRGCRYYFLYIFVSAAAWKIARGALLNGGEMSFILVRQHADLLSGACTAWICRMYAWLINHPEVSRWLYLGGVALEAFFVVGFFTRRVDRLLLVLAVLFVVADLLVMGIPYWPVLLGCVTLWLDTRPRPLTMVVYETTHHENLPALLDLCETRFTRVVVFLKKVSHQNIQGAGNLSARWPATEFVVQPQRKSNRRFIRRMFRFIRRQHCGHLHLSTLDNNLLLFATRLSLAPGLQTSLTVHEVNDYFLSSRGSLRDWTEAVAKRMLRRRIKNYTMFLPAMAENFRERMPEAVAVFIPSRFYAGPAKGTVRPFTIVIPGSVDERRRDYETPLEVLRSWTPEMPPVDVVILGDSNGLYGSGVVARLRALGPEGVGMRSYTGYVPQVIYEQEIAGADLLWSPLKVEKTGSRDQAETYGQTTASGLTADILMNNVPALVPKAFELPEPFATALLPYGSLAEAEVLLRRLAGAAGYRDTLREKIDSAFSFFVKANFSDAFAALVAFPPEVKEGSGDAVDAPGENI